MKERYKQARKTKDARSHGLEPADSRPDAFPEADDEIEGALTVSELDSMHASDSSLDDLTADTLIGDPREDKRSPYDADDEEWRGPQHHWIHRKVRSPVVRARQHR